MLPTVDEEYEALIQFLYIAPIGLLQARHDGEILMVNPLCAQLLMPLSRDGELSNLYTALISVAPDLRHQVQAYAGASGMVVDAIQLTVRADASGRQSGKVLQLSLLKLDDERLMAVISDVTGAVQRERELRQSQAWIHTLVSGLTDYALLVLDPNGCIGDWNPSIGRLTGHDAAATVGRQPSLFYPPECMPETRLLDRLHEADQAGWSLDEGWRVRADGSRFWGSCLIAPLHPPGTVPEDERAYSLIIRDVSDRREAAEALRRSVSCDHLTGLANRRALFEAAEVELQRWARSPRPLSLVLIDADHFKGINDEHGHAAGDAVLRHLAAGLSASFRDIDVVARLGGEEFVVLLPGATLDAAAALAAGLCKGIAAQTVDVDGARIRYTVSAGVATMDDSVDDIDTLIRRADAAMYLAKAAGRNRVERWDAGLQRPGPSLAARGHALPSA